MFRQYLYGLKKGNYELFIEIPIHKKSHIIKIGWNTFFIGYTQKLLHMLEKDKKHQVNDLITSFKNRLCNKRNYLMLEHFKTFREMLVVYFHNPI